MGRRNYWHDVIPLLVNAFQIPCKLYQNEMYIRLVNGSIIYILGADKRDAIEDARGLQFDLVIIDECKSYPTDLLHSLIFEVVKPTLRDRKGTLLLIGTPGSVFQGPFFEATYPGHATEKGTGKNKKKVPTSRMYEKPEQYWLANQSARPAWSGHTWQIKDNVAMPHLWDEAVQEKEDAGWADDEPIWLRESLAQWVTGADEFVYAYANLRSTNPDLVHWTPDYEHGNQFGLTPNDNTEWRYLLGIDTGYEDAFAMVVGAFNKHDGKLFHLWDMHESHLDPIAQAQQVERALKKFGRFDYIVVDPGGGGKGLAEMLRGRLGIPARIAEKTNKRAYQEFLNADFNAGRVKILSRSDLATQLASLQFDMSSGKSKEELARREKLSENPTQANDLCDAFLYMWRWSFHYLREERATEVKYGSTAWYNEREDKAMRDMVAQRGQDKNQPAWKSWVTGKDPLKEFKFAN